MKIDKNQTGNLVSLDLNKPNPDVVAILREQLKRAEAGEIRAAVVIVQDRKETLEYIAGDLRLYELIGWIYVMLHNMINGMGGEWVLEPTPEGPTDEGSDD